jgi:catechol 2,3-dioxygenase-like lactoylglutathione lyase family enzyme
LGYIEETMSPRLEQVHPVLMSRDVRAAVRFYERLGFIQTFCDVPDDPKYAGVRRDGVELHLQWHDPLEWEPGKDRPNYRFVVRDVDGLFEEFMTKQVIDAGTKLRDTPWGTREFHVRDLDMNGLQFYRDL